MIRFILCLLLLLVGCSKEPATQTVITYSIEGMHCEGCVESITAEVLRVEGVSSCVVSLDAKNAVVTFWDPSAAQTVLVDIQRLRFTVNRTTHTP